MKPRRQVDGRTFTCFDVWHRLWKCGKKPPQQLSAFILKPRQSKREKSGTSDDDEMRQSDDENEQGVEDEEVSDTSTHMPDEDMNDMTDTNTHMSPSNPSMGY